jgi:NDP-sugar pyrophosphorylase family protein
MMIEFHGRPFLAYLVEQLRGQGFEHIVLLLGYLPEVIQDYFGDGREFGVRIDDSVTAPDDLTGSRIKHAAHFRYNEAPVPCFAHLLTRSNAVVLVHHDKHEQGFV